MDFALVILAVIIAGGAGFFVGRNNSVSVQEKNQLQEELNEKQQELDEFRGKVTGHFEKTADLFNQVSDSYQSLYDHMAKSSNQLCSNPTFQALPQAEKEALEASPHPQHKTNRNKDDMFDANKLYNAHDYRNQEEDEVKPEEEEKPELQSDKVVAIDSAKDDQDEPALDYAIKEKGVINHNSLNNDEVKTS